MIEMRDAADPAALASWGGPVQGYPNRTPPWTPADFGRHARVMRTSVLAEASWARFCREIDVEHGAAGPADVPGFLAYREHCGLPAGGCYCNLSTWPAVRAALEHAGNARCRVRIADWTGTPHELGPDQLGAGWTAWAVQWADARAYCRNAVWGPADFARG